MAADQRTMGHFFFPLFFWVIFNNNDDDDSYYYYYLNKIKRTFSWNSETWSPCLLK